MRHRYRPKGSSCSSSSVFYSGSRCGWADPAAPTLGIRPGPRELRRTPFQKLPEKGYEQRSEREFGGYLEARRGQNTPSRRSLNLPCRGLPGFSDGFTRRLGKEIRGIRRRRCRTTPCQVTSPTKSAPTRVLPSRYANPDHPSYVVAGEELLPRLGDEARPPAVFVAQLF